MFDAYTVKKVMPRLVIAAILIQLSWPLFTLLVQITGQFAWGIEGLLYAPFGGRPELEIGKILEDGVGNGTLTLAAASGGIWLALGAPGLLALAIAIILALLVAVFVLSVRQVLIIMLLITAPVALVAWILPNTEKVWKLWWGTFSKLLLMYPLILLLLAAGRITARIVADTNINEVIKFVVIVLVFFGPFFLIAKTFQFAGGALASVSGALTSRAGRITGAMNKRAMSKQGARMSDWRTRADESRLFNPNGSLRRFNNLASTIVNPMATARIAAKTPGGQALLSQIGQSKWEATQKMAAAMSAAGLNDRALGALSGWDGKQSSLERIASDLQASGDANDIAGAQQLRNNAGFLLNIHKNEEMGRGSINGAAALAKASQGFTDGYEIAAVANKLDEDYKGMGLGNAFKTTAELAGGKAGALTKPGSTVQFMPDGDGGGKWQGVAADDEIRMKHLEKITIPDIGGSKGLGLDGKGNRLGDSYVAALSGDSPHIDQSKAAEIEAVLRGAYQSYTNPGLRSQIKTVLQRAEVKKAEKAMGRKLNDTEESKIYDVIEQQLLARTRMMTPNADELTQQQIAINNEDTKE